jgi:hypothetical protein
LVRLLCRVSGSDGRSKTADVVCTPDENRDYVRLWLTPKNGEPMVFRLSRGGAEVLGAEIEGSLAQTPSPNLSQGDTP